MPPKNLWYGFASIGKNLMRCLAKMSTSVLKQIIFTMSVARLYATSTLKIISVRSNSFNARILIVK